MRSCQLRPPAEKNNNSTVSVSPLIISVVVPKARPRNGVRLDVADEGDGEEVRGRRMVYRASCRRKRKRDSNPYCSEHPAVAS